MAKLRSQKRELRKVLAALAKNDRSTTEVVFNGFEIGSDSLSKLAMNLLNNTVVKVVCLNDCGITSKGAALLAFALRSNTTLRHLWLNGNKIGSAGVTELAFAVKGNRTLLTLALANNNIGDRGGRALYNAVKRNNNITDIFLDGNRISEGIEDSINRALYDYCHVEEVDEEEAIVQSTDDSTIGGTVISRSFVRSTLDSIKEVVDEEGDSSVIEEFPDSDDDDEQLKDLNFASIYQQGKQTKLDRLKSFGRLVLFRRTKVRPDKSHFRSAPTHLQVKPFLNHHHQQQCPKSSHPSSSPS